MVPIQKVLRELHYCLPPVPAPTSSPLTAAVVPVFCVSFQKKCTSCTADFNTLFLLPQDLMDFLNPNGSDCTLVLFYTPWCRFSASLAPHFNSLPRAFPALHFLALDASQHSRYLPLVSSLGGVSASSCWMMVAVTWRS